ncbi:luciferase family protein [Candidatus Nitrososphaera evergladensis]|uniref:luciferase domain-containing protein n=1 Tax=Candidatus Nitrososphaera evergladensis TaxID=1459637 RepID=UPI0011E59807|nr:luciferase family protein [Candidatus Nitrososphaera evergladensis]
MPSSEVIKRELLGWEGVTIHEHDFATTRFYVNGIEMGHIHGDEIADLQFPTRISKRLISEGKVLPHHVIPKSGWVSHEIQKPEDVKAVIDLFYLQHQRLIRKKK